MCSVVSKSAVVYMKKAPVCVNDSTSICKTIGKGAIANTESGLTCNDGSSAIIYNVVDEIEGRFTCINHS